ncbi:Meiotic recombination protein rec8 [Colletotrichum shisoi]|uniref:Meiotic recombination protein rec8 n=1 Tax=Colletotrichum shisoi TaxID=2078593 RepID=A0A5Q4BGR9_9PEZI|nr:Meiotic recombination protein rec8 [Colletotrichum shisoi]
MFYSHEILTSRQFGVATIWVVATIGPRGGGSRKVSRKAIEDVDIRKACEKIIEPGAPISLRLQSNLLYGVSRVYSSQCHYMLTDAEKVQTLMRTFFRLIANNETHPNAGKARRDQITLGDDPSFVPSSVMPHFTIGDDGNPCFIPGSSSRQSSGGKNKSQSQLSPFPDPINFFPEGREKSVLNLDISQSFDGLDYRLPSPFANSSAKKTQLPRTREDMEINMDTGAFGALDESDNFGGVELDIDENGAIILDDNELELPYLGAIGMADAGVPFQHEHAQNEQAIPRDAEGDVLMTGSGPIVLPGDPVSPVTESPDNGQGKQATAASKKRRRVLKLDNEGTTISRSVLRDWQEQYVENAERATSKPKGVTQAQAQSNAYFFTFGQGIGGVGRSTGIPGTNFPLADIFAGNGLRNIIYGPPTEAEQELQTPSPKGRRRRANEAFDEMGYASETRNVRPRVDETPQQGRSVDDVEDYGVLGDETMPEMGMEAAQPMDDHHSSSMMPWNRTPSIGRASSVIGHSAQRHEQASQKPAIPGRSSIALFELHDAQGSYLGATPIGMPGSRDLGSGSLKSPGNGVNAQDMDENDSHWMRSTLDTASVEFLKWTEEEVKKAGQVKEGDSNENRRWVGFEDLVDPAKQNHVVATQAFYHILSLATKNAICVEQRVENMQPFGPIRVGLDLTAHLESTE